ncbi:hypothetical protein AT6N2_C0332 [Agrobacterium tumefaciens]|uniref:hypothetical protein n=1 Tax=Agrobacterium tumefaciens TaxID=358 RepID=UPI001ADB4CEF|nr:hypothetical protein [Agrobacterium tumefaciens]QTK78250.1 hypothetical protein AT6N2_C0332 [Agrobacterium tumefaciens]
MESSMDFRDKSLLALLILFGAFGWGVCSAASAATGLYVRNRLETDHTADIVMLFFAGGFFGWILALTALRFLPASTSGPLRFAAACLAIAFFTLAGAAAVFAFEYRIFYAQWHASTFSSIWFFQQLFTSLGAVYQFAVLGLGLYFPFAALPLLPAGAILCRRARQAT